MSLDQSWIKNPEHHDWRNKDGEKITHVIIVCDTYDHEDYPVYIHEGEDVNERIAYYRGASMQRIMEVYNMSMDIDEQLKQHRVWNV